MNIILTSNSPGEISGWVKPVVWELQEHWPEARIYLFILPCSFASGQECSVATEIPGIQRVFTPKEYWNLALWNRRPAGYQESDRGLVLFLGGDQTHAVIIGSRLGYPVYVYTEGRALWPKKVRRYYCPYPDALARIQQKAPGKGEVVGNLMLDAVKPTISSAAFREELGLSGEAPLVALFPGSRPGEFQYISAFFQETAKLIRDKLKTCQFVVSLSPFIPDDLGEKAFGAVEGDSFFLLRNRQYDIMQGADLALTIPGTNTAEMAFLGLPMVVTVPLNRPELVPLEGIPGLIGRMPVIGKPLKRRAVLAVNEKLRWTALPNILNQKEVVPELRGRVTPGEVRDVVLKLLADEGRRAQISQELRAIVGASGAAHRLVLSLQKSYANGD